MKIYPVVHMQSRRQAVEQADLALSEGAHGVFLIDHGMVGDHDLLGGVAMCQRSFPGAFIGVNLLRGGPNRSMRILVDAMAEGILAAAPDALWVDDVEHGAGLGDWEVLRDLLRRREHALAGTALFGGVAFKYTPSFTEDPEGSAVAASRLKAYVDVVTTSGAGTGLPPSPQKIAAMHVAARPAPLAVASGIAAENLDLYSGSIDAVLVASSIETEPYSGVFNRAALRTFIDAVCGSQP